MKSKFAKSLILVIAITILFTGCSSKSRFSKEGIVELSFADAVSLDEIKKLDGRTVTIIGFMSTTSPLDGSYMYLQNMPYQSCPFCLPNTNILANTIAVYAPKGQSFRFQDIPLKVTGVIEVGSMMDELGYEYNYRLVDAKIERAEVTGLGREIRIYTELVDQGFAAEFSELMGDIYRTINHHEFDIPYEGVEQLSPHQLNVIKGMFDGLNPDDYTEIINVVSRLEELIIDMNGYIEKQDFVRLYRLNAYAQGIFNDFYRWLIKPSI